MKTILISVGNKFIWARFNVDSFAGEIMGEGNTVKKAVMHLRDLLYVQEFHDYVRTCDEFLDKFD